jgi:L-lactate dehydrogenase complex protein LldE
VNVSLFIPCYVDRLLPGVGIATVRVLERAGCKVDYPEGQTCCGQPPFNAGCAREARAVAGHFLDCFRDAEHIVVPSGSCAAMVKAFYAELFRGTEREAAAREIASRTSEFADFLVHRLGVEDVGAVCRAKVTVHDGCHGLRELRSKEPIRKLLRRVKDLELVESTEAESCCGFGGLFSVNFPQISTAMAEVKARSIQESGADLVVSSDPSCLLQISGYLSRQGSPVRCLHIAEVLA